MGPDGTVRAMFLGSVQVTYYAPGYKALVPGKTMPVRWTLTKANGVQTILCCPYLSRREVEAVRSGEVTAMEIEMEELK